MPLQGNQMVPNAHFHKDWRKRVKCWFDEPQRLKRRNEVRAKKALEMAPRPAGGLLRPIVRCCTARHNHKTRFGKGFSYHELKAAKICWKRALGMGVAYDRRRKNRSVENMQVNIDRLKEYKSRLVVYPGKKGRAKRLEAFKKIEQLPTKDVISKPKSTRKEFEARVITDEERYFKAYKILKKARRDRNRHGRMLRKVQQAAELNK